jgi:hypothetical protein
VSKSVEADRANPCASGPAYVYQGGSWKKIAAIASLEQNGGDTVSSCATSTFCMLIDNVNNAYVFNGVSWSTAQQIDPGRANSVIAVSCPTVSFCMAVDSNGNAIRYGS